MQKYGASASAVNKYVADHYHVGDYHDISGTQAIHMLLRVTNDQAVLV